MAAKSSTPSSPPKRNVAADFIRHANSKPMKLLPLISAHLALVTQSFGLAPITPPGGQIGTAVQITLNDENIAFFQELITYQPGLSLTDLKVDEKDNKTATATLHIAPDAALGEHSFRIRTAHDISYLRTFWVGPFPSFSETEPNNTPAEAQRIELNTTVQGVVATEDVDTFIVTLKRGQRLSVEAEAMRLGRILFDAYVAILDSKNFELTACDDAPFLKTDPYASIIAPEDGDYRIVIREAAYEGSDQSHYRLHIGTFPRPSAVYPPGGKPGETLDFTFIGDPTGPFIQTVTLPTEPTADFALFPVQNGETAPSPHPVVVSPLEHGGQSNQNFSKETAHPFPAIPSAVDGVLDEKAKERWFKFTAIKGQNLEIGVRARALRSPLDSVLVLHDAGGNGIANNDDNGPSPDSFIKWPCPADGDYFLQIKDQLDRAGDDFTFRIEINEAKPVLLATLPVTERSNSQKDKFFPVPRGNRYASVINLKRENAGWDVAFETADLPPGIRLITPPIPKSLNSFPVIFEAAPDAPLGVFLQKFKIRAVGEGAPPDSTGPLSDTVNHIEVNNEGVYHSYTTERIPTAVIEQVPFSIELEAPAVPIVKNGKLMLKMRTTRAEGFGGVIVTRFLWSPAGISGPANIDIAPDKTEAEYELNANADAAVGTWEVCVTAESDTPNGKRTVSSRFVPLTIAEPYLNFSLDLAAGFVGQPSAIVAKIEHLREFQGQATAELLSLPHGVTSTPVAFTKDQVEITFPLTLSAEAKPGKTTGLLCKVMVPENGQQILHLTGQGGTLRIDPAPVKEEPKPDAKPAETPPQEVAGTQPAAKPLSRLEQLRQTK